MSKNSNLTKKRSKKRKRKFKIRDKKLSSKGNSNLENFKQDRKSHLSELEHELKIQNLKISNLRNLIPRKDELGDLSDLRRASSLDAKKYNKAKRTSSTSRIDSYKNSLNFINLKNMHTKSLIPKYKSIEANKNGGLSSAYYKSGLATNRHSVHPENLNAGMQIKNSRTSLNSLNHTNPSLISQENSNRGSLSRIKRTALNRAQVQV
jgi:hypothetical protein